MPEAEIAILAKAPIPGFCKTRLIPVLGADGAARLQEELCRRAVRTALASGLGRITLWCAPDKSHPLFATLEGEGLALAVQPEGDLGARMLAAFVRSAPAPLVLIGADCPSLSVSDLRDAAATLREGADLVLSPAEDGGYGLIALGRPRPELFGDMPWSTGSVLDQTLARARELDLCTRILRTIWDVDEPADYRRLQAQGWPDRV